MMRKEEASDFPVYVVPVDLEEGKKRPGGCHGHTM